MAQSAQTGYQEKAGVSTAPPSGKHAAGANFWSIAAAALSLVLVELLMLPLTAGRADFGLRVDDSWKMGLNEIFGRHLHYGSDFVFTFGPLGFIYTELAHPATYVAALAFWGLLAFGWWAEARRCARMFTASPALQLAFCVGATAFVSFVDQFAYCWLLMVVFNREVDSKQSAWSDALTGACLAVLALMKFTFMASAGGVLAIGALLSPRYRRVLLSFLLAMVPLWFWSGQTASDVVPYLRGAAAISEGYNLAMACTAATCRSLVGWFVGAALVTLGLVAMAIRRLDAKSIVRLAALQLFLMLVVMKASSVRFDLHVFIAFHVFLFEAFLLYFLALKQGQTLRFKVAMAALLVCAFAAKTIGVVYAAPGRRPPFDRISRLGDAAYLLSSGVRADSEWPVRRELLRADFAVPRVAGSVDAFPDYCAAAIAAGDWRSRPVLQSYSAYNKQLEDLNSDFLASDRAPQHLLFEVSAIDGRMPTLSDSKSWLQIISSYENERNLPRFCLFRRADREPFVVERLCESQGTIGEPFSVADKSGDLLWAELEIKPTLLGRLQGLFFHLMPPFIQLKLADGSACTFNAPVNMTSAGFLLNPAILNNEDMVQLLYKPVAASVPKHVVTGFTIGIANGEMWNYKPHYAVRLYRVRFSPGSARLSKF